MPRTARKMLGSAVYDPVIERCPSSVSPLLERQVGPFDHSPVKNLNCAPVNGTTLNLPCRTAANQQELVSLNFGQVTGLPTPSSLDLRLRFLGSEAFTETTDAVPPRSYARSFVNHQPVAGFISRRCLSATDLPRRPDGVLVSLQSATSIRSARLE